MELIYEGGAPGDRGSGGGSARTGKQAALPEILNTDEIIPLPLSSLQIYSIS